MTAITPRRLRKARKRLIFCGSITINGAWPAVWAGWVLRRCIWIRCRRPARTSSKVLTLWQEIGNPRGLLYTLIGLGGVLGQSGQPDRAARLFGAVYALTGKTPLFESGIDRARYERTLALVHNRISPQAWDAAFQAGQIMSRDQAIALALEEVSAAQPSAAQPSAVQPGAPSAAERTVESQLQQYIPQARWPNWKLCDRGAGGKVSAASSHCWLAT